MRPWRLLVGLGLALSCVPEENEVERAATGGATSTGGAVATGGDTDNGGEPSGTGGAAGAADGGSPGGKSAGGSAGTTAGSSPGGKSTGGSAGTTAGSSPGGRSTGGTAGASAGNSPGGTSAGGMAGSSPGGANPGGQGGMAGGSPAPSDLLLYKLVERGTEFEAVLGYAELPDMRAEAEQLASDGYVITTALWDTLFSNQDMRYLAFKPTGSTTTYQVVLGYEQLPDMQAEATRLAAEGYVITTALWDTLFSDEDLRFLAFKPVGSTTTYEAVLGYEQLPDMQAEATRLAAEGYVITTALWDTVFSDEDLRFFAFKPVGSTTTYEAEVGYEQLPDMQAEATRLAAEGYVITTALWDTVFSDEDLRFFAFKPVGSMAARQAVVGYAELPDMQAEATQVATDGYVITTALWDTLFSNQDMRYFAISR